MSIQHWEINSDLYKMKESDPPCRAYPGVARIRKIVYPFPAPSEVDLNLVLGTWADLSGQVLREIRSDETTKTSCLQLP